MSWKNWGDHPVIVGVGLIAGISGIIGLIMTLTAKNIPSISNNSGSIQIGGSGNTINNSKRDIINVPCVNGSGSGGWIFEPGLPKEYFPISILKVQQWPIRSYRDHPMYKLGDEKLNYKRFGTCSIIPSDHP